MPACAAYGCTNRITKKTPGLTFHRFPKDFERRAAWILAVRRKDWAPSNHSVLCSNHFEAHMFDRSSRCKVRLREDAIPTVFEGYRTDCRNVFYIKGSVFPQEEKVDKIPLETIFIIKEEPRDDYPTTSTSTATAPTASEEFILPHKDSSNIEPKPVAESQLTLSVACLAPDTNEQSSKKRKASNLKTVTHMPSTNDLPASDEHDLGELSNPGSSKSKDQFDIYGEYIAAKLRNLDLVSCAFAQKAIGDVIFEAELGKYRKQMDNVKS